MRPCMNKLSVKCGTVKHYYNQSSSYKCPRVATDKGAMADVIIKVCSSTHREGKKGGADGVLEYEQ